MDELNAGLALSLQGAQAQEALARFRQQIETWGLAMPPAEPLVLDFGLGDFPRTGLIECWVANEAQAGYCGKFLYVEDGQTCPPHAHRTKVETFFVVKGRVHMSIDDHPRELEPGNTLTVPTNTLHSFTGIGPALLLEVSKPCQIQDNYFEDPRIPIGGNHNPSA